MAKIVILGAGLTGISTAYHLEQQGFFDYKIFEKESQIGGLCRSIENNGFTFDFTGHLLHINNDYFLALIKKIIGLEFFENITRKSYVYSNNVHTKYPFQVNLAGLPISVITECIEGFIKRRRTSQVPANFRQWVLQQFGKGFGKHFFFPYQKKIFAYNIDHLTASWTGRFVPATTLSQIVEGILDLEQSNQPIGYNAHFLYPKSGGIISWVRAFAQQLTNQIDLNHKAIAVDSVNKAIIFANGHVESYDTLVTTLPLDCLLQNLKEPSHSALKSALAHLKCNSVINFNLGINKPNISEKHWIYFPEKQFPFYRLGFPHNFSTHATPKNHSSLYGECAFLKKSAIWQKNITKTAIAETKKLLHIDSQDVVTEEIIHIKHAYVIYDAWRDANLQQLLRQLQDLNIYSIGRYGQWKYSSMQEAVLDGQTCAQEITRKL